MLVLRVPSLQFFQAPKFVVPDWDGIGPSYHQVGVHDLSVEARLHVPRAVWPGYRTDEERYDVKSGKIRTEDCLL